jgi:anti-sigma B factor antagonist
MVCSGPQESCEFGFWRLLWESLVEKEGTTVALRITNGEVDGVDVVWLDGHIVLGEETGALRETVKGLIAQGKKKLIFNMNNVTLIDSAGLGALVAAYSSTKSGGASLRLCHLGTKFNELLQITKLITLFEVYNSQADAIHSFSK